ncbi:CHS_3a_G0023300.mRNA.1.CDS.1 [Saccharomyces cerevisiae]|nr:ACH_G0023850.mRNA.1.CDS.1 [Saccharomyces cerevisiae]CAI4880907.1 CHS_3a_G0023300.mRNA.1.CDS.1 [Saccharomyces cerevisiae]CAI6477667.1 CIH_HP1_G0023540.mRNA.1.CDS.1 [Saccharomyces cerevisiae]CAI6705938.1 ACH_G0023850.mRNA.1.CDS.1 [Saccharomyces cerevisiae]CAI7290503.1 CHS_3a_G0023300.mRNA.1.CDS.1 [Saccharomyces cerevisiae]
MKVMSANANVVAAKIMNNAKNHVAAQRGVTATTNAPCGNKSEETKKSCCSGK